MVLKYRLVLGLTAALTLGAALFFLITTYSPIDGQTSRPTVPGLFDGSTRELLILWGLFGLSILLLIYSTFHYLVNRAAHRWADDFSVNQLDLVSPSRGFKLDTMRRPWCDPSPIRPEQALGELEALKLRYMGFNATGSDADESRDDGAWHAGVDTLVFSSQELASTFARSSDEDEESGESGRGKRSKEPRTREKLLEKYGVQLPEYVPSEVEMIFRDGRFYERKIHEALRDSDLLSFIDLSPRHGQWASEVPTETLTPAASDDDLDRFLMTLMAMEAGVDVIAEGCLMGRYTPPLGDPVGSHWLEIRLKTASEAQLRRFTATLEGGVDDWTEVEHLLTVEGEGPGEPLPGDKVESSTGLLDWIRSGTGSEGVNPQQLYRLFTVLLRNGGWDVVCGRLGSQRSGDVIGGDWEEGWGDLGNENRQRGPWAEASPLEAVAGLPIRRFKGFPDLLVRKELLEDIFGPSVAHPLPYVPVDIKQGNPFNTTKDRPQPDEMVPRLRDPFSPGGITLLEPFPSSVREPDKNPQYLAQLGLYSVLLRQAEEVRDCLHSDQSRWKEVEAAEGRERLRRLRRWITDDETFAKDIAPNLSMEAEPDGAALWIARGDGASSRLLPIPGHYLARQLETAVWELINKQALVAKRPEMSGGSSG